MRNLSRRLLLLIQASCLLSGSLLAQVAKPDKSTLDTLKTKILGEVVVSASRTAENILKAPVSIELLKADFFARSASPSFFDALENVKGIQMLTPSMGFRIINTRGFANTTNVRFTQMVDGFDNQAPHIGAPIGNAMGPSDLDIEKVEILPGTVSALYGLNAINGLANFITKDPFTSEGITFQQKTGITHINDANSPAKLFSESNVRIAQKISERLAFKINIGYMKGFDWVANNTDDLNPLANAGLGISGGIQNPAYDPVSGYGNESSNRRRITLQGRQYQISRTGYRESEMTDYDIKNIKVDLGLKYKLSTSSTLSYSYRFAQINNVYQRANRFALKDYTLQQHAAEYKGGIIQARAFVTSENTGRSYNLRSAAENMDKSFKSDNRWFADYTSAFNGAVSQAGNTVTEAFNIARQTADLGRPQPDTEAFNSKLRELSDINNWDIGAALRVKDKLVKGEVQLDLSGAINKDFIRNTGLEVIGGMDYQAYLINPDGNYFINPVAQDQFTSFSYAKTGAFLQAGKTLVKDLVKVIATIRADRNDYFPITYNPRIAAIISPGNGQSVRFSFQSGSRFPSIFEAFSNVNSGGVRRVGGLKIMSNGVFENAYLRSSIDRFQAAVTADFNNGIATNTGIERQKGLLIKNYYSYLDPEKIKSFELGYRGIFSGSRLKVDADVYYNKYKNFIAQVEMNVPNVDSPDAIPTALNDRNRQSRYRLYTNSRSIVYNVGGSLGLSYHFLQKYLISGNLTYANLSRSENTDSFEDGFNTPNWMSNISLGGDHLLGRLGFQASYRHQSSYYWQSFLVNGQVGAFGSMDTEINATLLGGKLDIKVGGTNVLNNYYYSYLGGPSIGAMYYTTLTYKL